MTSSNGNIFRVTDHLCGQFTGPRWIPHTQASDALMFPLICVWINGWVNNRGAGDLRRYRAHYDVSVMILETIKSNEHFLLFLKTEREQVVEIRPRDQGPLNPACIDKFMVADDLET